MIVCVPSMRHSGTRLIVKSVLNGFTEIGPADINRKGLGDCVVAGHVYPPSLEYIDELMRKFPAIAPMRHPARIWKSYTDRVMHYDYYFDHWMNFIKLYKRHKMSIIHIDSPNRDQYLEKAANRIGRPLSTDWPVDHHTSDLSNAHIEVTGYMESKIPRVIMDFYESTL